MFSFEPLAGIKEPGWYYWIWFLIQMHLTIRNSCLITCCVSLGAGMIWMMA